MNININCATTFQDYSKNKKNIVKVSLEML